LPSRLLDLPSAQAIKVWHLEAHDQAAARKRSYFQASESGLGH